MTDAMMMNPNTKKRASRTMPGRGSGGNRFKPERNVQTDGVYGNVRLMHTASSLVGVVVQIQARNGDIFEGVFKTFSNKFEIVLEMAHKVDPDDHSVKIPARSRVIEALIMPMTDVVMVTALNVDLDYAVKDNSAGQGKGKDGFTDAAISKFNGEIKSQEIKELQPWIAEDHEVPYDDRSQPLEADTSNGWTPDEMFKQNEEKYGVQSTYDHTLADYTTPLEKKTTKEYIQREAEAQRIAAEIESSSSYKSRINLEITDNDDEARYSAVMRPSDRRSDPREPNTGRYVIPVRRGQTGARAPRTTPPLQSVSPNKPPPVQQPAPPTIEDTEAKINGEKMEKDELMKSSLEQEKVLTPLNTAPVLSPSGVSPAHPPPLPQREQFQQERGGGDDKKSSADSSAVVATVPPSSVDSNVPAGLRKTTGPVRDEQIAALKRFSTDFKLTEEGQEPQKEQEPKEDAVEEKEEGLKSKLNPNAAEFKLNVNARPFIPKVPTPQAVPHNATPPLRPQSPIVTAPVAYIPTTPVMGPRPHVIIPAAPTSAPRMRKPMPNPSNEFTQPSAATAAGAPIHLPAGAAAGFASQQNPQYPVQPGQAVPQMGGTPGPYVSYPTMYTPMMQRMVAPGQTIMIPSSQTGNIQGVENVPQVMFAHAPNGVTTHVVHPNSQYVNPAAGPNSQAPNNSSQAPTNPSPQQTQANQQPQYAVNASQPPVMYQPQMGQPPLQPSPHPPTSPQPLHGVPSGTYTTPQPPHFSMAQPTNSVQSMTQQHHQGYPQQVIFVPQAGAQFPHAIHTHQFQAAQMQHPHLVQHSGVQGITVSTPTAHHPHIPAPHYIVPHMGQPTVSHGGQIPMQQHYQPHQSSQ